MKTSSNSIRSRAGTWSVVPLILICFFMTASFNAFSSTTWQPQLTGTTAGLQAIFFLDEDLGWSAGSDGVVLKTYDGGKHWSQLFKSSEHYLCICFMDSLTGIIAGENGCIKTTTNGGLTWNTVAIPGISSGLNSVQLLPDSTIWVCGENGVLLKGNNLGASWDVYNMSSNLNFNTIRFFGQIGYLAGDDGKLFKTTNGGYNWTQIYPYTTKNIHCINGLNEDTIWLVGEDGLLWYSANGGTGWGVQTSSVGTDLNAINFIDSQRAWCVGDNGVVLYTSDGGSSWNPEVSNTNADLQCVCVRGTQAWAVGSQGTVIHVDLQQSVEDTEITTEVSFYPNPFLDEINISMRDLNAEKVNLQLYLLTGQLLDEVSINANGENRFTYNWKPDCKNLNNAGAYHLVLVIQLQNSDGSSSVFARKLIKVN